MKDQVTGHGVRGLKTGCIASQVNHLEKRGSKGKPPVGLESLLICRRWREVLQVEPYRSNVLAFVVDEAHCVKKW